MGGGGGLDEGDEREICQDRATEEERDCEGMQDEGDFPFEFATQLGGEGHGSDECELRHGHEGGGVLAAERLGGGGERGRCKEEEGEERREGQTPVAPVCSLAI